MSVPGSKAILTFAAALATAASLPSAAHGAACPDDTTTPTCSAKYYKISDEFNGLATSCAAVDQPSDPVVGLDQAGCQASCDALAGCDTVNFRWRDPNFDGQSTCYRKTCGTFRTAACTLFSKHKERDVYTKACGAGELYDGHSIGDAFEGLFAGVECPDDGEPEVAALMGQCANGTYVESEAETCSARYYKLSDEFNRLSSNCPAAVVPAGESESTDPLLGLDQSGCQAACDSLGDECDTIEFRWKDPSHDGRSSCFRKNCGDFEEASCSLMAGQGRDVYTKACGATAESWAERTIADANTGLFVVVGCPRDQQPAQGQDDEGDQDDGQTSGALSKSQEELGITCDPAEKSQQEADETVCVSTYYKISDEANGLATSCAAVDQTADPVVGLDQAGCQRACDDMDGCDTINFRWIDPNFNGQSTCYRKRCGNFEEAACTLFAKHKSRDVYTKACGAAELYREHILEDGNGLFAGVQCPDETNADIAGVLGTCSAAGQEQGDGQSEESQSSSCTARYYKISDEFNGLATSCAAVDQTADPVVGLDQAGCQASCDALDGCDTVNFRWRDPNFEGQSTCYRKRCETFQTAACTLFSKHKERDVFTKACGSEELWADNVLTDGEGLFAGVRCPGEEDSSSNTTGTQERTCTSFISTNRTNPQCDVCSEWSGGSSESTSSAAAASVRTCLVWEKTSSTGISSCREYAPSALQLQQKAVYNEYLQSRWSAVGVCDGRYIKGTICEIDRVDENGRSDGTTCEVRDQPCHGGTELGGVAGVLSAGWQMTFGTSEDSHVCTMCGRGTYGSCDGACDYRRNFFWSGVNLGRHEAEMDAQEVRDLFDAFVSAQPEEKWEVPQTLDLTPEVQSYIPADHPLHKSKLPSQSVYSVITVNGVMLTVREQLELIAVGLVNSEASDPAGASGSARPRAQTIISTSGVKVYETCQCYKCPRGQFQDGLGETKCKSCQDILPGSNTTDTGADGPQLCECLETDDKFPSADKTHCVHCDDVRKGNGAGPPETCGLAGTDYEDSYVVSANRAGFADVPANWVTSAPCDAVRAGEAAAPLGACRCDADTYETNATDAGITDKPVSPVPQNWITCVPCPSGSSTFNADKKRHDYGSSVDKCYCQPGDYAVENGCASCPSLKTSDFNSQSSTDCRLTDAALLMAIVIPTGVVLFAVMLTLLSLRYSKKIRKLEQDKRRQMQEKVNEATEIVNHLAHPMVFLSAHNFLKGGKMIKHEEARANQTLITVDTMQELKGFKKTNTLIFFSHQWLAWAEPDPQKVQYNAMVSAMHELAEEKGLDLDNTFVWLDYTSIPQTHRGLQRLSINSLTNYAGACDYLIVVAPGRTVHADTGTTCDKKSYQDRAWCRAEQLAHGCRKGVEHMYLTADGGGLEPVTWDWIKPSFKIFSGQLTCCARGHDGMEQCDKEYLVTPVLGLYCELRALEKISCLPPEKKEILDFFREHEEEVFPQRFNFSMGVGKQEERELFGEILHLLDELDLKEDNLNDESSVRSGSSSRKGNRSLLPKKSPSSRRGSSRPSMLDRRGSSQKQGSGSKLGLEINFNDIIDDWSDDGLGPAGAGVPPGFKKSPSMGSCGSARSAGSRGSQSAGRKRRQQREEQQQQQREAPMANEEENKTGEGEATSDSSGGTNPPSPATPQAAIPGEEAV